MFIPRALIVRITLEVKYIKRRRVKRLTISHVPEGHFEEVLSDRGMSSSLTVASSQTLSLYDRFETRGIRDIANDSLNFLR